MSKIGIFMADGCEEIEGLTVVDIVRPVAPYRLAELRRRTAGDGRAHTGHPIIP